MFADDRDGLRLLRFETLPADRVDVGVTTRLGGESTGRYASLNVGLHVDDDPETVVRNRRRLFTAFDLPFARSVWCTQVHEARVAVVDEDTVRAGPRGAETQDDALAGTDAVITAVPGIALCVMLADCVPVVVYDPDHHVVGVAHAGWRGTVARISSATVRTMRDRFGSNPARLVAAVGPSISPTAYEVGADVADAARAAFGDDVGQVVLPAAAHGKWRFDLWRANALDLEQAGLPSPAIEVAGVSTTDHLDELYSHRAERATGRFATITVLR